jgi:hypothetical protein
MSRKFEKRYTVEIVDPTGKALWENQFDNQGLVHE